MTPNERIPLYLEKCPPAISGNRGHDQTFAVACALVWGFALEEADALPYFLTWNAGCVPPWKERDLRHKLQHASKVAHTKPRGHLLGTGENRQKFVQTGTKAVPVRLTPKVRRFRTLRTDVLKPCVNACARTHTLQGTWKTPSEASEKVPAIDWTALDREFPPDAMPDAADLRVNADTWHTLAAHPLGREPLVHVALNLFGPGCRVISTGEASPCES